MTSADSGQWEDLDKPTDGWSAAAPTGWPPVVDQKITVLPFQEQHWNDFEKLLLDTVIETESVVRALRYGGPGQDQGGIDIAGVRPDGTWHAYQAKKVERFLESDAKKAVSAFVAGRRPFGAKRLVIATACSVTRTQVRDLLHESQKQHTDLVLEQVWDAEHLSRLLRPHPRIVARFGGHVARRFCDADALRSCTSAPSPSGGGASRHPAPPGQPLSSFSNPFSLEVHEAIRPVNGGEGLPTLPAYVRRSHDQKLRVTIDLALSGNSSMAVLLGDSSTGKTRAAWEAIQRLPEEWKLWHPSTQASFMDSLDAVEPHTVLWLNEIHRFLITSDEAQDERTAGALRRALGDPTKAPVLILGTIWHEYWQSWCASPAPLTNGGSHEAALPGELPDPGSGDVLRTRAGRAEGHRTRGSSAEGSSQPCGGRAHHAVSGRRSGPVGPIRAGCSGRTFRPSCGDGRATAGPRPRTFPPLPDAGGRGIPHGSTTRCAAGRLVRCGHRLPLTPVPRRSRRVGSRAANAGRSTGPRRPLQAGRLP